MVSADVSGARVPPRPRDGLLALVVVAVVFVLQLPFRMHGTNIADEGAILTIGAELLRGRHLYGDVVHPAFPGIHWLTAALFALFGPSFETARTFTAALFAATTGIVFLIARWFLSRRGALGFVVLFLCYRVWAYPHWHMLSYSSTAVALVLIAAWIVGNAFARPGRAAYVAAGVVAGWAFITKQDSGAAGTAALGIAILLLAPGDRRARWWAASSFAAGGAVVVALATLAFVATGTLGDLVDHTLIVPFRGLREFQYQGSPALWPLFRQDAALRARIVSYMPSILFDLYRLPLLASRIYQETALVDAALKLAYHLPLLVLLVATARAVARRWTHGPSASVRVARETLVLLVAAAFWVAFNRPHDWIHLLVLFPPTLLLGTLLVSALIARSGRWRPPLLGAVTVLLVALFGLAATIALHEQRENGTPVHSSRGTVYGTAPQARGLQELVDGLAAAAPPGAPVVAYPYHPIVTFISGRPLLGPYISVWPAEPDLHRTTDIIAAVEAHPDGLLVYSPNQIAFFPRMAEYSPELFRYLVQHFEIGSVFGGDPEGFSFFLLRRKTPVGGRTLLGPPLAHAAVGVEPADGPPRALTPAQREAWVAEALWPFARVLRVTTFAEVATVVRFRLTPAAGEHFRTAYGDDPDHWSHFPDAPVRFGVAVEPVDGPRRDVVDATVDPLTVPGDRRWTDVDVDLTPWAGQPVDLVLRTTGAPRSWPEHDRAGWAEPRIE